MEKGKFYKSKASNLIVLCIKDSKDKITFCGIVISENKTKYKTGYKTDLWRCSCFEEHTQEQILKNKTSYTIPDGCIAKIKGNQITIESIVRYYYKASGISEFYTRIEGENVIVVIKNTATSSSDILFKEITNINTDNKTECTEAEFLDVYNEAYLKKSALIDFLKKKKKYKINYDKGRSEGDKDIFTKQKMIETCSLKRFLN